MLQQALLEPGAFRDQVRRHHRDGAASLLEQVNRISGISLSAGDLTGAAQVPGAVAGALGELGRTPQEIGDLTLGQVLLHLGLPHQQG